MYLINFSQPIHIHFIGIGGISMSGLAEILLDENFTVSGSDNQDSNIVSHLRSLGATINIGQRPSNITDDIDLVVYTAAIHKDNKEFQQAITMEIPMLTRAQLLGQIMSNYEYSVAISGTHGKTTTTSMLSEIFINGNFDPTISVGGILESIHGNIRVGQSEYFVTEACEYTNSFLSFNPKISVILNVEEDHLDFFSGIDEIIASFKEFAHKLPSDGLLVINGDMEPYSSIIEELPCRIDTIGLNPSNKYSAKDISYDQLGRVSYTLVIDGKDCDTIALKVGGVHNVTNSLAAIAVALYLNADINTIKAGLNNFTGAKRRFEYKGKLGDITIIDDYAHHPSEISATLKTAQIYPHNEIWCIFQPHTYSRTIAFLKDFAKALSVCDHVVLTDIYAARETNTGEISSKDLAKEISDLGTDVNYFPSFDEVENFLLSNCKKNDLLITMGAGDVFTIGNHLLGL